MSKYTKDKQVVTAYLQIMVKKQELMPKELKIYEIVI